MRVNMMGPIVLISDLLAKIKGESDPDSDESVELVPATV
ncbi:hypothetical protein VDA_000952 [Photobacterium damselae subsp. damselae CIP 102761]|uniref:Uncharacterized protein n=2 Tax=Photobacterium damselae subsp. damselae TaxID=85581 RepID=D0Z3F1_PHODD|nr:hypothetical protein VDA_000952 [Photobacterium damselae subsp. damselae CIP 102761]